MMMLEVGAKVKISLTNHLFFKGTITEINETHFWIIDKFGASVMINKNHILVCEVIP